VGDDAVYFDNPDLPNTRSEMALPLRIAGDEIIGVLDVQSIVSSAFQQEDIEVLSTLADQVAVAIQNARTYETMQELARTRRKRCPARYLEDAWRVLESEETSGWLSASRAGQVNPTDPPADVGARQERPSPKRGRPWRKMRKDRRARRPDPPARRGDRRDGHPHAHDEHDWDEDEVDIAEAVADRLSLALETSLLLRATQRRAETRAHHSRHLRQDRRDHPVRLDPAHSRRGTQPRAGRFRGAGTDPTRHARNENGIGTEQWQ
jgi:GAF domain-containing protein